LDHRFQSRFGMEILMGLGREQDRRSGIHKVAHLYHMLFFALATGGGTNGAHIFKIDLHLCQWLTERFLAMRDGWISYQQSQPGQQLPDRARRTRERASSLAQLVITR
jgi:hypothetical protein